MDIVKRLRKKSFMQYESETTAIADEAADEIEKLREALSFYATRKHYDLFVRAHSSMGEYETSFIQDDGGQIAREVLGEK